MQTQRACQQNKMNKVGARELLARCGRTVGYQFIYDLGFYISFNFNMQTCFVLLMLCHDGASNLLACIDTNFHHI